MNTRNCKLCFLFGAFIWFILCINGKEILSSQTEISDVNSVWNKYNIRSDDEMTTEATTNNEYYASIPPPAATPLICDPHRSNNIIVQNRTSSMFIALICYNGSLENQTELFVFANETRIETCNVIKDISSNDNFTILNVGCDHIENNAGRNWMFNIGEQNATDQIIFNETFIITLQPLYLAASTDLEIIQSDDPTEARIVVQNCTTICDVKYLVVRCSDSDLSNETLSENCIHACYDLQPGSMHNFSLVRLDIRKADKNNYEPDNVFNQETLTKELPIKLDKVTNFAFVEDTSDKTTMFANLTCPRGRFDEIVIICSMSDSVCVQNASVLYEGITACSNFAFIPISPIQRGVSYICQATTKKQYFQSVYSQNFQFHTNLEPVIYGYELTNRTEASLIFNVTPQGDFDHFQLNCMTTMHEAPCINLSREYDKCVKALNIEGVYGCNYQCSFITKKESYIDFYSRNYPINILPKKPILMYTDVLSKSITIKWNTSSPTYFNTFIILLNGLEIGTHNGVPISFIIRNLAPNRDYRIQVVMVSNYNVSSNSLNLKTKEDAPERPTDNEIKGKINPLGDHVDSKSRQYVVQMDKTLFSDANGMVYYYLFYVRQDHTKHSPHPMPNGTYLAALSNPLIDYFALNISRSSNRYSYLGKTNDILLLMGNDSSCIKNDNPQIPCNGPLKPNTNYSIIVQGCTQVGCTSVVSRSFITKNDPEPDDPPSLAWIIAIPIILLAIIVGLIAWRRRVGEKNVSKLNEATRSATRSNMQLNLLPKPMRPRRLIEYLNIDQTAKTTIYHEYDKLEEISPTYRKSDDNPKLAIYNRFQNIPARGQWDTTAVYLTGQHRTHDYINANEITSFDQKQLYIACQAPLENTCEDFWDMIIQYKVKQIVMLTRIEEQDRRKSYPYFPQTEGEILTFNDKEIKLLRIEHYHYANLNVRHLAILQHNVKYNVMHYYFKGWSDFKTIETSQLIGLIEKVNRWNSSLSLQSRSARTRPLATPIVVHCSAGIGRTGTYIAVDTITHLLDRPGKDLLTYELDVMAIVYHLRQQRIKMVQTKEQYLLIYRCVEEYLKHTGQIESILQHAYINSNGRRQSTKSIDHDYENLGSWKYQRMDRPIRSPIPCHTTTERERTFSTRSNQTSVSNNKRSHPTNNKRNK